MTLEQSVTAAVTARRGNPFLSPDGRRNRMPGSVRGR